MFTLLNNAPKHIANDIYDVFQRSYKIEAELLDVVDFPPLSRTANDISKSSTNFLGFYDDKKLAAVLEFDVIAGELDIHSLVVDPDHFRKGIAKKLLCHVLTAYDFDSASVETAAANKPAIKLYEKQGFIAFKTWTPAHGIEKIALRFKAAK